MTKKEIFVVLGIVASLAIGIYCYDAWTPVTWTEELLRNSCIPMALILLAIKGVLQIR